MQSEYHIQSVLKKIILNQYSKKEVDEGVNYIQEIKESSQQPSVGDVLELLEKKEFTILEYAAATIFIGLIVTTYFFRKNISNTPLEATPYNCKYDCSGYR